MVMLTACNPEIVASFARNPVIKREIVCHMKTEIRRIQTGRQEIQTGNWFSASTGERRVISLGIAEVRGGTQGGERDSKIEADNGRTL